MVSSIFCCFLLFITFCCTDGYIHFAIDRCVFNSSELKDIEFIMSYYYNKKEFLRFNSTLGHYIGFTDLGVKNADRFNKMPGEIARMMAERKRYCQVSITEDYQIILPKSVKPTVRVYSTEPSSPHHPSTLVCQVFDFYPKSIKVTWLRDGQEISSDVTTTDEMEDGDWYYQAQSELEYMPRSGEKISCMVEHVSLSQPLITDWEPSMPESERIKLAIGASGLTLGVVCSLAGFIYYRREARGRNLVPTN